MNPRSDRRHGRIALAFALSLAPASPASAAPAPAPQASPPSAAPAAALGRFEGDRAKWPRIDDFVPEVVRFFEQTAVAVAAQQANTPKLLDCTPATGTPSWDATGQLLTIPVVLVAATNYRFGLNSAKHHNFRSKQGVPLAPVEIRFTTR